MEFYDSSLVNRNTSIVTRIADPRHDAGRRLGRVKSSGVLQANGLLARMDSKGRVIAPPTARTLKKRRNIAK